MEKATRFGSDTGQDDNPALCNRDFTWENLGGGNSRVWTDFKLLFDLTEEGMFWYQLFLGKGDWKEVEHGSFPYAGRPVHPSEVVVSLMGEGWRWLSYRYTKGEQELPVQIYGKVLTSPSGSPELPKGKAEIQLLARSIGASTEKHWAVFWLDLGVSAATNKARGKFVRSLLG